MRQFDFSQVLTTGAGGMIGAYVDFGMRPDRQELDVLDGEAILTYVEMHRPQAIIHLAGATDMARCEGEPAYAYELNVRGTYNVARAARTTGIPMVYASTSRVFKGNKEGPYVEDDAPEPETHYGRTKHIGELITAALVPHHIIARTAWVFGGGPDRDNKFYGTIIRKLIESQEEIVALNDVYGSPTYAKDFIGALKELLENKTYGTFHIANAGEATRFDIARELAERLKPGRKVCAVDRSHFATGASLPTNEAVSSKQCVLRPWKEALAEYIDGEWISYLK
jgi:dTDP-4-dehydrorhamnose reductase